MKNVATGPIPRACVNPWDEGDYRIYGYAIPLPDGTFEAAYAIDRVRGVPDAPKTAVRLQRVHAQHFATKGLTKMMAVSHGVNRVRRKEGLS